MIIAGFDQRLDHRLVGVALLAFVVDDALAGEAGRGLGEGAVFVDGVGDGCVDAARFKRRRIGSPDLEVFATMAGRGVHEACAGVVGDVIASEQRHMEIIAALNLVKRMCAAACPAIHQLERHRPLFKRQSTFACLHDFGSKFVGEHKQVADFRPIVRRRFRDFVEAVSIFGEKLIARFPGSVQGVVVQMTIEALSQASLRRMVIAPYPSIHV